MGETVFVENCKGGADGECDGAFAPCEEGEPVHERGSKEPAREREPGQRGERPLEDTAEGLGVLGAREPEEEKGEGGPAPGAFDEPKVEGVGFVSKVVGLVEMVGKVSAASVTQHAARPITRINTD